MDNSDTDKSFIIRSMCSDDWPWVKSIYLDGIATKNATFEAKVPASWEEWSNAHLASCRLVAANDNKVLGWIMLNRVSDRPCYIGVAEVSVYVALELRRTGIGYALLSTMIKDSQENGFWTLQAGVFPENVASLALHKKCGFREVGVRKKIARLDGKWRDMLLLEHRS